MKANSCRRVGCHVTTCLHKIFSFFPLKKQTNTVADFRKFYCAKHFIILLFLILNMFVLEGLLAKAL